MLHIEPISFKEAAYYVDKNHRHNKAPVGHKFSIALYDDDRLCGVAQVGRPVARMLDDGVTLEVNRVCTDGTKNACSMLYGASKRAAQALGYHRLVTYTLETESGSSPKAAGFERTGIVPRSWQWMSRPGRNINGTENYQKIRWEISLR